MNAMTLNHRYTLALYKTRSLGALRDPTSGHLEFVHRALQALRPCDPKSNAHAHMCAFALDGVKIVGYGRTNKAFLGVGFLCYQHRNTNINDKDHLVGQLNTPNTFSNTN